MMERHSIALGGSSQLGPHRQGFGAGPLGEIGVAQDERVVLREPLRPILFVLHGDRAGPSGARPEVRLEQNPDASRVRPARGRDDAFVAFAPEAMAAAGAIARPSIGAANLRRVEASLPA